MKISKLFKILLAILLTLIVLWLAAFLYQNNKYRALGYAFEEKDILKKQDLWWEWDNYHLFKIICIRFKLPQSELNPFLKKYHYHDLRMHMLVMELHGEKRQLKYYFNAKRELQIEIDNYTSNHVLVPDIRVYSHNQSFANMPNCWHPELIKDPLVYFSDRSYDGSDIYDERIYYDKVNEYLYYYGELQV